jgi:acyl-CoA dehydrogenase
VVRSFVNDCIQRLLDGTLDNEAAYMAKWWCSEQQCKVMDECLQLFGGYGYMEEYPIAACTPMPASRRSTAAPMKS